MNKILRNKKGLTLIELLSAVTLTSLIFIFAGSFLVKGINHYNNISNEIALRDEADIIMSNLVRTLYTTKESTILLREFPKKNTNDYYLEMKPGGVASRIGFVNQTLRINHSVINIANPKIEISRDSKIEKVVSKKDIPIYRVTLVLSIVDKNKQMIFVNDIRTIYDTKEIK